MKTLEELVQNEEIREEYKKTMLLIIFKKICVKMKQDEAYRLKINNLFKQSFDRAITIKEVVAREYFCDLTLEEATLMNEWFWANQKKKSTRKTLSQNLKGTLYKKQGGVCKACGEMLGDNWSKIHIDHIIPWVLVGDELPNNYQVLCETCNECKNSRVDYMLIKWLNLI